jgi:DNA helicase-2/ATP-dependent DNA helicase PcrA
MITDQKIWDIEKSYLENVINEIKTQLDHCMNATGNYKKEAIAMQKEMWQDSKGMRAADLDGAVEAWQYQVDISKQALKYKFSSSILNRLEKMYQNPYFGRIDFIEQDEENTEQIYIGIYNLSSNNTSDILVYDWRTPIASMFYDYEVGSCSYSCPAGLISGQMSLKRQYKIENQNMIYMFDSSLRINDEMLQEILGKSTDSRMKTIVTSIQREQNSIIRNDQNKILIVQGSAGSGKTSIALHRVAYLLYKHRETIKSENILILSPNHVFEEYISNVLPELGEENVERSTFADFFVNVIDTKYKLETSIEQMEAILSADFDPIRMACIQFKTSFAFLNILKKYVASIENGTSMAFNDLIFDGQLIISANDIYQLFNNETINIPFSKRLQKLGLRLLYLLEPYQEARTQEISESDIFDGNELSDNEKKSIIAQQVESEFESIKKEIAQMTAFDIHQLYTDLFKNIASFTDPADKMKYEGLSSLSSYTLSQLMDSTLNYEDMAPILFLKTTLDTVTDTKSIKHVIIDEAQDYTPIQYEVFKSAFGHCNMTILGDLNQSINAYMNIGSFDMISDIFNKKDTSSITLSKSYRSTKQIANFCNALLTKQNNTEQLNRQGCKPNIIKVDRSNGCQKIADHISTLQNKGYKLIAVICKTARECEDLYTSLSAYIDICLISKQKELYPGGVIIIPSYLAKGLEFDAVIISSIENDDFSKEEDRKLLYTVCTRALHELNLYYFDDLSRFIKEMDKDLYVANLSSIE